MNRAAESIGAGRALRLAIVATGLVVASAASAQDDQRRLSPAQIALFESDHLGGIGKAERLEYSFRHESADTADSYRDRVDIDVRPRGDGAKDVWADFLSGDHHLAVPPLMGFHGNPVIMFFLEHDVVEMNRLTGGTATYFRNRIRRAFVDKAEMRPITVERGGKTVSATEITLTPFTADERIAVFPGLAEKQYRFVLSDAVPGGVLEIEAAAPSRSGQFSTKETMMFESEGPCAGEIGPCAPPAQP